MISKEDKDKIKQSLEDFDRDAKARGVKQLPKIWLDEDGIIHIELEGDMDRLMEYSEVMMDYTERTSDKTVLPELIILVKIPPILKMPSLKYRKKGMDIFKRSQRYTKFKRMATCGGGAITKVSLTFILRALGVENIKHFKTEKEALRWLRV